MKPITLKSAIWRLNKIWYTKSGYQNEDLPLAYDEIVELIKDIYKTMGKLDDEAK